MQYLGFAPDTLLLLPALQKEQLVFFFGLFVSFIQNLPQLQAAIFSPLGFLCSLFLEKFVPVQALQQRVPGPCLSHFLMSQSLWGVLGRLIDITVVLHPRPFWTLFDPATSLFH